MYRYLCLTSDFIHWFYNNFLPLKTCLFSIDFYFDNTLILWTLAIKWCMATCARSHACGVFNVFLNSRWWFMLCLVYIPCLVLTLVIEISSVDWTQQSRLLSEDGDRIVSETLFLIKNWATDNVEKVNYCANKPLSQNVDPSLPPVWCRSRTSRTLGARRPRLPDPGRIWAHCFLVPSSATEPKNWPWLCSQRTYRSLLFCVVSSHWGFSTVCPWDQQRFSVLCIVKVRSGT
jgi:hypothetical protein